MKKILSFLALALCISACQNKTEMYGTSDDMSLVTINIAVPELATRADGEEENGYDSAYGAIRYFGDAEWEKYDLRYTLEVYNADGQGDPIAKERLVKTVDKYEPIKFDTRLVNNREYKFVVFADIVNNESTEDLYYNTENLREITMIDGKMSPMDEARDAYFISQNIFITGSNDESLILKRPFGKIRVIATDIEYLEKYAAPKYATVTYYNHEVYKSFNAVNGQIDTARSEEELTFTFNYADVCQYTEGHDADNGKMTIFADYLLAGRDGQDDEVNFKLAVYDANNVIIKENDFKFQIPIKRNHLTTIIGDVLTEQVNINVTIVDNFDDEIIVNQ